jgi:hypothetical protein
MLGQLPYDYLVQRGLELLLEEHGLYFPHAIVAATKDFQRLTYTVRVNVGQACPGQMPGKSPSQAVRDRG